MAQNVTIIHLYLSADVVFAFCFLFHTSVNMAANTAQRHVHPTDVGIMKAWPRLCGCSSATRAAIVAMLSYYLKISA